MPDLVLLAKGKSQKDFTKEILQTLEDGIHGIFQSERWRQWLDFSQSFYRYSSRNRALMFLQNPEATYVASMKDWNKRGRKVIAGQGARGLKILAPTTFQKTEVLPKLTADGRPVLDEAGEPVMETVVLKKQGFVPVSVYDVSQTEGEPIPTLMDELRGSYENYDALMQAITETAAVPLSFEQITGSAKGFFAENQITGEGRIVIQTGMSEAQTLKTAIHELAHSVLHSLDKGGSQKPAQQKELEAESTAYLVCRYYGLDTSDYSFPYLAAWSRDQENGLLKQVMDTVVQTAEEISRQLDEKLHTLNQKQDVSTVSSSDTALDTKEKSPDSILADGTGASVISNDTVPSSSPTQKTTPILDEKPQAVNQKQNLVLLAKGKSQKDFTKEILQTLEDGTRGIFQSERWRQWLDFTQSFHQYSSRNRTLMFLQNPEATYVASMEDWNKRGRRVIAGQGARGLKILSPTTFKSDRPKTTEDGQPVLDENGNRVIETVERKGLTPVSVYDISQTEGKPIPAMTDELKGSYENYDALMQAITETAAYPLRFEQIPGEINGLFIENPNTGKGYIVIQAWMPEAQTLKTAIHELTHSVLHRLDKGNSQKTAQQKELEAESAAYLVCRHYGLDTSGYSFPYLAAWSRNQENGLLNQVMDTVVQTAEEISRQLDEKLHTLNQKQDVSTVSTVSSLDTALDTLDTTEKRERDINMTAQQLDAREHSADIEAIYNAAIREVTSPLGEELPPSQSNASSQTQKAAPSLGEELLRKVDEELQALNQKQNVSNLDTPNTSEQKGSEINMTTQQQELLRQLPKINCTGQEYHGMLHIQAMDGTSLCMAGRQDNLDLYWNRDKLVAKEYKADLEAIYNTAKSIRETTPLPDEKPQAVNQKQNVSNLNTKPFYDIQQLKEIPLVDICELYGIPVNNRGGAIYSNVSAGVDVVATDCETCKWQIEMSTGVTTENPISIIADALDVEATMKANGIAL